MLQVGVQGCKCPIRVSLGALPLSEPLLSVQRGENPKVRLHGLEVAQVGVRHIVTQGAKHGGLRK